ncbi:MAG: hypothetical protein Q8P29_04615 [Candidatus Levybacteria bacterium]|nr:hypothetical protein [Candidatus Levybacteria bacterium]
MKSLGQLRCRFKETTQKTCNINAILAPNSSEFLSLKDVLEDYLNRSPVEKTVALLILGLNTAPKIVKVYRKARNFALRNESYSSFYERFGDCIKDYLEQFPQDAKNDTASLIKEDVIMFLNGESQQNNSATFTDLKTIIKDDIFKKRMQQRFFVHPQEIPNWQGVLKPQAVLVVFSEENSNSNLRLKHGEIKIVFGYESEEGEKQHFAVTINPMKEEMDWNFLEDPNDPEMKEMKDAAMLSIKSVLHDVKRQIKSAIQGKPNGENNINTSPLAETKTKSIKEKIYVPREKSEKPVIQKPLTPIQQALNKEIATEIKPEIKRQICLEEERIKKIMDRQNIPLDIQTRVTEKISEFNSGTGYLKPLLLRDPNKKPILELRVGKFRVLVTEKATQNGNSLNGNGISLFEVINVGARKDVFKKVINKGVIAI